MDFQQLLNAKESERDSDWEKDFLRLFPEQSFSLIYPEAKPGPDNWPYLWISSEANEQAAEPATKILDWLSQRGIGLVVNPNKNMPDYVFTYGMLWLYALTGQFIIDSERQDTKKKEWEKTTEKLFYGYPKEDYIPTYVRSILKEFFLQQGIMRPKWILLTEDKENYDLCFSLESLNHPAEKDHQSLLEAISWFFPNHYSLVLTSEKGLADFEEI